MAEFSNILRRHKLKCGWCGHDQNAEELVKLFANSNRKKMSMPCEKCELPLTISQSVMGFLSAYQSDRLRLLRNIEKGVSKKNGLYKFTKEKYDLGYYDVITKELKPVVIGGINLNASKGHQIIGWLSFREGTNECYHWDLNGRVYGFTEKDNPQDLLLKLKQN